MTDSEVATDKPVLGILEWFRPGEESRVERALDALHRLKINHLRTGVSWADWMSPQGRSWYEWLLPTLGSRVDVLPCFSYTPPSLNDFQATNAPPRRLEDYSDFVCYCIELFGEHFEWVELWNEPDNHREWNAAFDDDYSIFSEMIANAGKWARNLEKKVLLGGLANADPNFLSMLHGRGVLDHVDAVGVHGFPFSFEFYWEGWPKRVERLRERLDWCGMTKLPIWITECGYSTWRHDPLAQAATFVDAMKAPADRIYWYALDDLDPRLPTVDGFHSDEREYHFGLSTPDGRPKLLGHLLQKHAPHAVATLVDQLETKSAPVDQFLLVTGGCGNRARSIVDDATADGADYLLYDNLSSEGSIGRSLRRSSPLEVGDVLDEHRLRDAMKGADRVVHAALVADASRPEWTYRTNTIGTLHVLQAAAEHGISDVTLLPPESTDPVVAASLAAAADLVAAYRSRLLSASAS